MGSSIQLSDESVISKIYFIRGKKVMLDRDLAEMYGVETKRLNEQVKRNAKRFPKDFMFQLNTKELENWKSQFATSNSLTKGLRKLPFAFTEQGVAMLSSVLNTDTSIEVNIQIIRIFTKIRDILNANKDALLKIEQLEKKVLKQNHRVSKQEKDIQLIFEALKHLLNPVQALPKDSIGFRKKQT
ncbi:MAG: DNA-binding protein [Bacteroidetes bacterium B1(2017)]|nr:MAG: DNA-binding protein [Bacteroidetes bacterium B1(2017)]